MKRSILVFGAMMYMSSLFAQQEAMFTHYMYNTLAVNPAYAGSRDALTATVLHRSQWIGFQGAPVTQTFTLHSPVYTDAINLGFSVVNDKIGPLRNTSVFVDYAFRIKLSKKSKLAFGMKVGLNYNSINLSDLNGTDPNDQLTMIKDNALDLNIGAGVYYSRDNFYAGFSTPKLFQNNYEYSDVNDKLAIEKRHYYFIMGGLIPFSNNVTLKPTALVKITQSAPIEADMTAEFIFKNHYSLGVMYRTGDAAGFLVGISITDKLNIGYSFDCSFINSTAKYNSGSHEIMLRYDLIDSRNHKNRSGNCFCGF